MRYSLKQIEHLKKLGVSDEILDQISPKKDTLSEFDQCIYEVLEPAITHRELAERIAERVDVQVLMDHFIDYIKESYKECPSDFLNDIEYYFDSSDVYDEKLIVGYCKKFGLDFDKVSELAKSSSIVKIVIGDFKK